MGDGKSAAILYHWRGISSSFKTEILEAYPFKTILSISIEADLTAFLPAHYQEIERSNIDQSH